MEHFETLEYLKWYVQHFEKAKYSIDKVCKKRIIGCLLDKFCSLISHRCKKAFTKPNSNLSRFLLWVMKYRPLAIHFLPGPSRRLAGPGPSGPWPWSSYATVLLLWYDIFCSILEWLMDFRTPLIGFCIWTNRMTNGRNTHRLSGYRDSYVGSLRPNKPRGPYKLYRIRKYI